MFARVPTPAWLVMGTGAVLMLSSSFASPSSSSLGPRTKHLLERSADATAAPGKADVATFAAGCCESLCFMPRRSLADTHPLRPCCKTPPKTLCFTVPSPSPWISFNNPSPPWVSFVRLTPKSGALSYHSNVFPVSPIQQWVTPTATPHTQRTGMFPAALVGTRRQSRYLSTPR